jgi:tetratricopeptide (TPR) repeat protein
MCRIALLISIFFINTQLFGQADLFKIELAKADSYIALKNYPEALKLIEGVLEIEPLYLDALEKKVNVMLINNDSKTLLKEIEELISQNIQQPEYYYIRALINNYKEHVSKAVEDLDDAIYYQMPEEYLDRVYLNRGVAYYKLGKFDKAEMDFRAALEINPRYATVYHSWGMLDYELNRFEEAVKKFNKAVQYGDEQPILYYNLGMSYKRLGDMKKACQSFNIACTKGGYKDACKLYFLQCAEQR